MKCWWPLINYFSDFFSYYRRIIVYYCCPLFWSAASFSSALLKGHFSSSLNTVFQQSFLFIFFFLIVPCVFMFEAFSGRGLKLCLKAVNLSHLSKPDCQNLNEKHEAGFIVALICLSSQCALDQIVYPSSTNSYTCCSSGFCWRCWHLMSQQCLSVSISCLGNVATYTLIGLGLSIQILLDFCVGFLVGFFFNFKLS